MARDEGSGSLDEFPTDRYTRDPDAEPMVPRQLYTLRSTDTSFRIAVTTLLDETSISEDSVVDLDAEEGAILMTEADVDPEETGQSRSRRTLNSHGTSIYVEVPPLMITQAFGIEHEEYDSSNPLVMQAAYEPDGRAVMFEGLGLAEDLFRAGSQFSSPVPSGMAADAAEANGTSESKLTTRLDNLAEGFGEQTLRAFGIEPVAEPEIYDYEAHYRKQRLVVYYLPPEIELEDGYSEPTVPFVVQWFAETFELAAGIRDVHRAFAERVVSAATDDGEIPGDHPLANGADAIVVPIRQVESEHWEPVKAKPYKWPHVVSMQTVTETARALGIDKHEVTAAFDALADQTTDFLTALPDLTTDPITVDFLPSRQHDTEYEEVTILPYENISPYSILKGIGLDDIQAQAVVAAYRTEAERLIEQYDLTDYEDYPVLYELCLVPTAMLKATDGAPTSPDQSDPHSEGPGSTTGDDGSSSTPAGNTEADADGASPDVEESDDSKDTATETDTGDEATGEREDGQLSLDNSY